MVERRKSKRYPEKNRAVINCYVKDGSFIEEGKMASIRELSLEGTRLFTYFALPQGTECKISLDLERSSQMVQLWAQVKWVKQKGRSDEYEMGFRFLHNEETRAQLKKHLYGEKEPPS